jgi:hypothetical protein
VTSKNTYRICSIFLAQTGAGSTLEAHRSASTIAGLLPTSWRSFPITLGASLEKSSLGSFESQTFEVMSMREGELIILLGAGASVDAGIPASGQMITKLEGLLESDESWKGYPK